MNPSFPGLTPDVCFFPEHLPTDADGYAIASNGKGGKSRGHRLAYRLFCGPIRGAAMVLHVCGNAQCINPHHLYLGDAAQNARDRARHGKTASGAKLPQTKLNFADVLAIRSSTKRVTDLAREFNTSKGNISSIRAMRNRRGVKAVNVKAGD
ncbi:MAG: HNH endonuclease [Rhodoferax sp.]|nr:HNH endonuclease [Rhodoferax sp.]